MRKITFISSFFIKVFALLFMTLDHVGLYLRMQYFDNDGLYISEPFFEKDYHYVPEQNKNRADLARFLFQIFKQIQYKIAVSFNIRN